MIPYYTVSEFNIGFLTLHVWGMFAALGFLAGILFAGRLALKSRLDPQVIYDFSPWLIIGSIIGARIVFLLENPSSVHSLIDLVSVWNGGMAFHGGFAGGFVAVFIYARKNKIKLWEYADVLAPAIALGHAIGRIGCYVTGLHIGKETSVPWAVYYDGALRHPTPAYEFIGLFAIFFFLLWIREKKIAHSFHGFLFFLYIALYSALRFFVEYFRTDPTFFGLTIAQYIVIALFLFSSVIIWSGINRKI